MYIASASSVLKFHDFPSNQLIHTYQPTFKADSPCRSISWAKDGNWLAVVPYRGCTEIITLKGECKLLHMIQDISEPSCANFQNTTKRYIAVGTKQGQVLLYDIKSKSIKARYPRTSSIISHVGFTAKDTHCYAGCVNGDILLFNNVAKNLSCTLKVPKSHSLTAVRAHLLRRNFLIGGSNEGIICVWDVNVNKIKFQTEAHSGPVTSTIFSPLNSTLVVSAGLDREVRVFDIDNQSRITSVQVENNILSLDFLEDSLYIIMGSQNGKIHIYDTRSLKDPVCSFEAHDSAIKHIACYNGLEAVNNSSLCSMVNEDVPRRPSTSHEEISANKKRFSDFFGLVGQGNCSVNETFDMAKQIQSPSMEAGDSFMQALGFDKNNTADSLKEDRELEEVDNKMPNEKNRLSINTPRTTSRSVHDKQSLCDLKIPFQNTSTPKIPLQNFSNMSPIVALNTNKTEIPQLPGDNITEIHTVTKDLIQGEIKKCLDEMENKIIYQFMNQAHQIRRMVLDLHMASLKEFIKLENHCNSIREGVNPEAASSRENLLMEENISLRKKVQELEKQIAGLTTRDDNAN